MRHHVRTFMLALFVLVTASMLVACGPPPPPSPPACVPKVGAALDERFDVDPVIFGHSTDTPIHAGGTSAVFDGFTRRFVNHLAYGDHVTVEAWIKPSALPYQAMIFDDYGSPGVILTIWPEGGEYKAVFGVSTTEHPGTGTLAKGDIVLDQWQHLAGTYDGTALRLYIDGVLVAETPTSGPIINEPHDGINSLYATIGANDNNAFGDEYFGLIDDVRVYHRAITVEEMGVHDGSECTPVDP